MAAKWSPAGQRGGDATEAAGQLRGGTSSVSRPHLTGDERRILSSKLTRRRLDGDVQQIFACYVPRAEMDSQVQQVERNLGELSW